MREKLSLAALAVTGAALLAVLFTPAGGPVLARASTSSERTALRISAEASAAAEDRAALANIGSDLDGLLKKLAGEGASDADPSALVAELVEKEVARRWGELKERMDSISAAAARRAQKPKE